MTFQKLFQVLVVGGALLGAGCREEETARADAGSGGPDAPPTGANDAGPARADAAPPTDATAPADAPVALDDAPLALDEDAGELVNCGICPTTECCVPGADGTSVTRAGFECCWGSSC